jgi:hypothetical protein
MAAAHPPETRLWHASLSLPVAPDAPNVTSFFFMIRPLSGSLTFKMGLPQEWHQQRSCCALYFLENTFEPTNRKRLENAQLCNRDVVTAKRVA